MSEVNQVMDVIMKRRSVRAFEAREVPAEVRAEILRATLRAPTAGNLMLYSILEIADQTLKDRLALTCDNQPFIARSPLVWVFLADYQRWYDVFRASGVEQDCAQRQEPMQKPEEGDLFMACSDALIAAQTAVLAAESFGLGSCYIGDIMEQYETHRELLCLPQYVFPICMLTFGYPAAPQLKRAYTTRYSEQFILFRDHYHRLEGEEIEALLTERNRHIKGSREPGLSTYQRKFNTDFSREMRRSVRVMLKNWSV